MVGGWNYNIKLLAKTVCIENPYFLTFCLIFKSHLFFYKFNSFNTNLNYPLIEKILF
jgi:hypothetical protein